MVKGGRSTSKRGGDRPLRSARRSQAGWAAGVRSCQAHSHPRRPLLHPRPTSLTRPDHLLQASQLGVCNKHKFEEQLAAHRQDVPKAQHINRRLTLALKGPLHAFHCRKVGRDPLAAAAKLRKTRVAPLASQLAARLQGIPAEQAQGSPCAPDQALCAAAQRSARACWSSSAAGSATCAPARRCCQTALLAMHGLADILPALSPGPTSFSVVQTMCRGEQSH